MFFIIPFGIFAISLAAICWIISRKFVYLKKLAPEVVENSVSGEESFWAEFFPGLAARFNSSNVRQFRLNLLAKFEKFLRKLRLLSLKLDVATNHLIRKVRKSVVHHEGMLSGEAAVRAGEDLAADAVNGQNRADPREEEQRLIIEIAKNPKNGQLYKKLGNIYMKLEEWHDAAESFKKVLELEPEDETTRNKLTRLLKKIEKLPT
ncbi:MAG: tetratricopeptide repeat protein [Candidatus Yanofskybacteria bacterium]|nr:tetratricopeptide repeat protein [Candidatus Yanofskybacteria bacterium]